MLILLGETGETANLSFSAGRLCQPASDETIGAKSIPIFPTKDRVCQS